MVKKQEQAGFLPLHNGPDFFEGASRLSEQELRKQIEAARERMSGEVDLEAPQEEQEGCIARWGRRVWRMVLPHSI